MSVRLQPTQVEDDLAWLIDGFPLASTSHEHGTSRTENGDSGGNNFDEEYDDATSGNEEDNWYDEMEVDQEADSNGFESDASYRLCSADERDENASEEDDFSCEDEEVYPEDGAEFLRYGGEFNDIFAGEDDGSMNEPAEYTGERVELNVGMKFNTVFKYRDHLRLHAIQNHYEYRMKKNESNRVMAICLHSGCQWRCHASTVGHTPTFKVKTLSPLHTCPSRAQHKNKMARSSFVTHMITKKLRETDKTYSPKEIRVDIKMMFGIKISYHIAWYSRILALEQIYGNYDQAYIDTPELCAQIVGVNPRNKAKWFVSPGREFSGVFICFHTVAETWRQHCRPVIGLDGCFLKGKYGGGLSATGLDGNGGLFPLAICITTGEDTLTWKAFLKELHDVVYKEEQLTFYSARQKGLLKAVLEEFPFSNHKYCMRHIFSNFEKYYKGKELKDIVYEAASAYDVGEFHYAMSKLQMLDEDAYYYMRGIDPSCWARSHWDWSSVCCHITNNMFESFNNMIKDLRDLPVTIFVEKFHETLVQFINERRALAAKQTGPLTIRAMKDLGFKEMNARLYNAEHINETIGMVLQGERRWEVNLAKHTCSCIEWQISGMPCVHAVVTMQQRRLPIPMYYHSYFHLNKYVATYAQNPRMIPDRSKWNKSNPTMMLPPPFKREPGRLKTSRSRAPNEPNAKHRAPRNKCSKCQQYGHNSRSCDGPLGGSRGRDVGGSVRSGGARGGGTRSGGSRGGRRRNGWRSAHRGRASACI